LGNNKIPKLSDIANSTKDLSNYLKMEQTVLKLLDYKLDYDTSYSILKIMLLYISDNNFSNLAFRILDFFIHDIRFIDFAPLEVASAVICLTSDILQSTNYKRHLLKLLDIKVSEYMNCYIVIKRYYHLN
jgi:hypothetical protein